MRVNNESINTKKKIEVKCTDLNDYGQGIFMIGKTKCACSNLLPKETAIVEESTYQGIKKYKVLKFIKTSSSRVETDCKIYNRCGSCHLLHLSYKDQINFKIDYVCNALKEYKLNSQIDEVCRASVITGYRNKMQVCYRYRDKQIVYGFYEEDTHRVIANDYCLVHTKEQNEIVKVIGKIMSDMRISPYDEDKRTGIIRFVIVREAIHTKEFLVTIVINGNVFPGRSEFIKKLREKCPYITSIVQNINTRKTSIILGDDEQVLYGTGYITDELCGIKFKISSKTFYQVNPYQTEILYGKVKEYLDLTGSEVVLDAYCGVGTIGMTIAKQAKAVIGVESNKQSVINARLNASNNNIKNMRFVNEDATEFIEKAFNNNESFDYLIMDPPRSGSTVKFLQAVKKIKPRKVVYVSCEAKTLARDLQELVKDNIYRIVKKSIVDMFVGTYHIETVVLLERIDARKSSSNITYKNKYMTGEDIDMLRDSRNKKNNGNKKANRNVCDRHWDGA